MYLLKHSAVSRKTVYSYFYFCTMFQQSITICSVASRQNSGMGIFNKNDLDKLKPKAG